MLCDCKGPLRPAFDETALGRSDAANGYGHGDVKRRSKNCAGSSNSSQTGTNMLRPVLGG